MIKFYRMATTAGNPVRKSPFCTPRFFAGLLMVLLATSSFGQTPYPMQNGNFLEDFNNITNWGNVFASSGGEVIPNHSHWGVASTLTAVPVGPTVNQTIVFQATPSSSGVQRSTFPTTSSPCMALQTTGGAGSGPNGTNACAADLYLDFRNRIAGTLSFNWAQINNPAGNRPATFRVFVINSAGNAWVQLGSDIIVTNGTASNGTFSQTLPAHFNYNQNARIRFYVCNANDAVGTNNRPKLGFDNVSVTSTPCTATKLVVTDVNSGNCPVVGIPFPVTIQTQSADNNACAVAANTNVGLGVGTGTGTLAGTTTTTFNAASFQNTFTFTGLTYDAAETGVSLDASRTSGDVLTTGSSAAFEVIATTAVEPTVQASLATGTPGFNSVTLTLTPGNGANRIVVARQGSPVAAAPVDATPYTANAFFGSGSTTGTGQFVVYSGSGTSVNVTGLVQGQTYHFAVYEFNGAGCALNYLQTSPGTGSVLTPVQTLVPGDISMIQLRGESPDGFSFVANTAIAGGTQIRFTDVSWTGTAFVVTGTETNVEYVWTSPASTGGIATGTVVSIQGAVTTAGSFTDGVGAAITVTGISNAGDQIFAYRGTFAAPSFIAGITSQAFITTGPATAGNSYRPAALAGTFATEYTGSPNNNIYFRLPTVCGTLVSLRSVIADQNNWFGYGNFNIPPEQIFQAPSYWTFNVVGSLATEPTVSAVLTAGTLASSTINLFLASGNGNGRLVIAKLASNATNSLPTDGVTYSANLAYATTGTQIGSTGNFVVYSGSAPSITVTSLLPLTEYTFTVYEYDNTPCINYRTASPGTVTASTTVLRYYSKNAQKNNLENLSAWSLTPNELGASPANFTDAGVWYIIDDLNATIGAPWAVSGASSKVILGNNASFTIPTASALTTSGGAGLDVGPSATLTLQNNNLPNLMDIDSTNSTVNFDMTGTVVVPAKSYFNLRFQNGTKQFPTGAGVAGQARFDNTIRVNGNLVVDGAIIDPSGSPFSFLRCNGNITSLNASTWGSVGDVLSILLRGTNNQTIAKIGAGPDIILFLFDVQKSAGFVAFGAGTNMNCQQDVNFNLTGTAFMSDNGVNINVGDDLRLTGAAARYNLTGTFTFNNLVNDNSEIEDGSNNAPLAALNNVVIAGSYISGSTEFRFRPNSGTQDVTLKGNLAITNAGAICNLNSNNIRIGGNISNSATTANSFQAGNATLTFIGTTPQTVNTSVVDEVYGSIANLNPAGVTFGQNFTVSRNWTNTSGNFNLSTVTTTFSGTATQNIGGLARTTFSNLVLNTTAGTGFTVNPNAKVSLTGTLTFGAGADLTINPGGEFRLVSSPSGTASIANTAAGTVITGNLTSERYVPTSGWHLTGTVFPGQTIMDWNDDLATQGPMPGVETPNPGSNTSTIFEHDQTYTTNDGLGEINGWKVPTTSAVSNLKGYRVSIPAGATLDNSGTYAVGTKNFTLVNSGTSYPGYNLLVNPHLSSVTPTGFTFGSGVQNTVVVWNPTAGQYQYVGSPIGGISANPSLDPLVSGQGFFVYTTTNGATLGIPETAKTTGGTFFRTATSTPGVSLRLVNHFGQADRAVFQFLPQCLLSYEPSWDARKILNPGINVFTLSPAMDRLAVNGLPYLGDGMVIPVGYQAQAGAYALSLEGIENLEAGLSVYLRDNYTQQIVELGQGQSYAFTNSSSTMVNDRFELVFSQSVTGLPAITSGKTGVVVYPNPVSGSDFHLDIVNAGGDFSVEVLDMTGRLVSSFKGNSAAAMSSYSVSAPSAAGTYTVRVLTSSGPVTRLMVVK